jgi:hypothetical protein
MSFSRARFRGLGTVIMLLMACLYSNAFAQSCRNIVTREGKENAQATGIGRVSGPVVSIVIMVLLPGLKGFGGIGADAGGIGFPSPHHRGL